MRSARLPISPCVGCVNIDEVFALIKKGKEAWNGWAQSASEQRARLLSEGHTEDSAQLCAFDEQHAVRFDKTSTPRPPNFDGLCGGSPSASYSEAAGLLL
jgi:hypothetical protein